MIYLDLKLFMYSVFLNLFQHGHFLCLGTLRTNFFTVTKEREEKNFVIILFCCHKFHKIEYYVIFEMLKKKIWANFQRIVEVFTQKIFNMLSNIWVWDPGSGKNLFRIPGPGSRGQKGTGYRIRIRNTGATEGRGRSQ